MLNRIVADDVLILLHLFIPMPGLLLRAEKDKRMRPLPRNDKNVQMRILQRPQDKLYRSQIVLLQLSKKISITRYSIQNHKSKSHTRNRFIFTPKFGMKNIAPLLLLFFCINASAQSVSTTVKFNKADRPALMLYLPYNEDVAEGTILTKLKEIGFEPETKGSLFWKQNKVDGYYAFKGVVLKPDSGTNVLTDLYFKVDRRGKKKDNQSVIYLLTGKGADNFVTDASDPTTYNASQKFLNGFTSETATYKHTLDVQAQEETVKKAEKKMSDLLNDEKDMNKKIAKLQDDLQKNKQGQANQQATIEAERKKLADMKLVSQ